MWKRKFNFNGFNVVSALQKHRNNSSKSKRIVYRQWKKAQKSEIEHLIFKVRIAKPGTRIGYR